MKKLNLTSKNITGQFFNYDDITLRLYLDIVKTLDVRKLLYNGKASNDECQKKWDEIIQKCSSASGGLDFINFIDLQQKYGILLKEYNIVKSWLTKLWFIVDDEIIEQLVERGYNIITTKDNPKYNPAWDISENYKQSLLSALQRSEHLVTKIKMTANELKVFLEGGEGGRKEMLFDEIMAQLLIRGIKVEENITLSRYIELLKAINKPAKEENVYG